MEKFNDLATLILDVNTHGGIRRWIWLRPGQSIRFGRTHLADECFSHDDRMSSRHFLIEPTPAGWCCRDLKSTNGTFLNETQITEAIIRPGDRIRAGHTIFTVLSPSGYDQNEPSGDTTASRMSVSSSPSVSRQIRRLPFPKELHFRAYRCRSGLAMFLGVSSRFDPGFVAGQLAQKIIPLIVADQQPVQAACPSAQLVPLHSSTDSSEIELPRVIVTPPSADTWEAIVQSTWCSNDALVLVPKSDSGGLKELVPKWHDDMGKKFGRSSASDLRPAEFAELLANGAAADVAPWFEAAEFVFFEAFQGDRWGVLARPESEAVLLKRGFAKAVD